MMNKQDLINQIKFHCDESEKYLLELHLQDENLSQKTIQTIKDSFQNLKQNLISSINNAN